MSGKIASIAYSDRSSPYCYIAIHDNSSTRGFYFHEVKREQMCRFAERCVEKGFSVNVIADAAVIGSNKITTIEHGSQHQPTKWWTLA